MGVEGSAGGRAAPFRSERGRISGGGSLQGCFRVEGPGIRAQGLRCVVRVETGGSAALRRSERGRISGGGSLVFRENPVERPHLQFKFTRLRPGGPQAETGQARALRPGGPGLRPVQVDTGLLATHSKHIRSTLATHSPYSLNTLLAHSQ